MSICSSVLKGFNLDGVVPDDDDDDDEAVVAGVLPGLLARLLAVVKPVSVVCTGPLLAPLLLLRFGPVRLIPGLPDGTLG